MPERSKEFGASNAKSSTHHEEQDTSSTSRKFCQGRDLRPETMAKGPVSGRTRRWRKEYLINLNSRQKWFQPKRNLKIGDIVIVQEEVPRNEWPLGKITDTSTDQQGLVRSVKIKLGSRNPQKKGNDTNSHIIERPVQKVVLLLEGVV